jgi:hypothetical protein
MLIVAAGMALLLGGCAGSGQIQVSPDVVLGAAQTAGSLYNFSFSGGDGLSMATAVVITAPNELAGINAELNWAKANHPDWKKRKQDLVAQNNRTYHRVEYRTADYQTRTIWFDVTACLSGNQQ